MAHTPGHDPAGGATASLEAGIAATKPGGASVLGPASDLSLDTDQRLSLPVYISNRTSNNSFNGKALPDGRVSGAPTGSSDSVRETTVTDAYDEWHRMSKSEQRAFAKKLEEAGVIEPGDYNYASLAELWKEAVDEAADITRVTKRPVTPQGYLKLQRDLSPAAEPTGGPSRSRSTDTSTSTDSNVNLSNRSSARAAITDVFRQELGRDPSRKEAKVFFKALNAAERGRPATSSQTNTQTQTSRNNGNPDNSKSSSNQSSSSSSTSREGLDRGAFTQNYVDDRFDGEQDSRMAATGYYDALLGLAGGGS